MQKKTTSLALLIFLLIFSLFAVKLVQELRSRASTTAADLAIIPAANNIDANQEIALNITVNTHAHKITTSQLELTFDNTKFDFVSITPGIALDEVIIAGTAFANKIFLTLGKKPVLVSPGPPPVYEIHPYSGSGTLAILKLKSKAGVSGTSAVSFNPQSGSTGTIILDIAGGSNNVVGDMTGANVSILTSATPTVIPATPTALPPTLTISCIVCNPLPGCTFPDKTCASCGQQVCSSSPTPIPGKPGDANGNNIVDGEDYVVWLNHYEQNLGGVAKGDFNNSGNADGIDYVIWLNNYGR